MRIANWHEITDAAWVRDNLLNVDAAGGAQLKNLVETVMLVPYGSSSVGNTQVQRSSATLSPHVGSRGAPLLNRNVKEPHDRAPRGKVPNRAPVRTRAGSSRARRSKRRGG